MRAFWIGLLVLAAGCGGTCEVDGRFYRPGEHFTAPDGCNTCSCGWDGSVACTEMACPEDTGDTDDTDA